MLNLKPATPEKVSQGNYEPTAIECLYVNPSTKTALIIKDGTGIEIQLAEPADSSEE